MSKSTEALDVQTEENITAARSYRGIPPTQYLIPYRNVAHLLERRTFESPDKIFLIYYDGQGNRSELTYAQFSAKVNQTANLLVNELGVRNGDRVATISYSHADTVIIYFACWKIGATVAPQSVTEDDTRIAFILRNSEAVICLVRQEYLERAERIIHGTELGLGAPHIRQIVQIDGDPKSGYMHYPSQIAVQSVEFEPAEPTSLESECLLVYTSGTTGAPKGVVLIQYNMLVDAKAIADWQGLTGNQRLMNVLPIHHVNGIIITLIMPLYIGGSIVVNRQYQSSTFWVRIAQEKVHVVSVVPTLLQFSCEFAESQQAAGKSIWGDGVTKDQLRQFRHLMCGGGTLAVSLTRHFEDLFGVPILHGYGLSETTCVNCTLPIDHDRDTHRHWLEDYGYPSIGCPINANEMAIFDATGNGQQLDPGQRGEICIRGHNIMKYYFQRPDANRETFKFGWFRSGDEGFYEVDEQGRQFFFISGRIKELINRGGVKYSPMDIEEILLEVPGVKVGLAVAFENDYYGEEVGAYVVLSEGATVNEADILTHCRSRMSFEKSPKVVLFGTDIPVTTTGKYQRLRLRDRFGQWKNVQFRK